MRDSTTKQHFLENLKKYDYKLLTNIDLIKNINDKIKLLYNKNNITYEVVFRNFADGYLPHRNNSIVKNLGIENFKKRVFALVGDEYEVLPDQVYINNKTHILMKHKTCGNIIDTLTPGTFLNGKRCKYCSGKYTPTLAEVKEKIKNINDFKILNINDYKDLTTKNIQVQHNCGYSYTTSMQNIIKHVKCPKCANSILKTTDDFRIQVSEIGNNEFEVLDNYIDCKTKIRIKHKKCNNIEEIRPFDFLYNRKCKCLNCKAAKESMEENEVRDFIKSLGFEPKKLKKKINNKWYELDIYIDELKLGIEYDGLYWHSEKRAKDKKNLYSKMKAYNSIGIRVVNVFEDEWIFKKEIVKSKLKSILQKNNMKTIFARNCIIKNITSQEKNNFLNNYHIQGEDKANIKKGLFYQDKLIAVMTFSAKRACLGFKGKTSKINTEYELSRFATAYHIPGAFSKLLKTILKEHPEIKKIITYADLRWSDNKSNVYDKNGFELIRYARPNYWYTDGRHRYHRYNFRKQLLKKKFPEFYDDKLTEFQIMDKTNYRRIWDCGNLVYEYIVK